MLRFKFHLTASTSSCTEMTFYCIKQQYSMINTGIALVGGGEYVN